MYCNLRTTSGKGCQNIDPEVSYKVVELLLPMMMEGDCRLTSRNLFQCQHNNRGYCKFGNKCRYMHFTKTCTKKACKQKECPFRHPKPCRNGENCKQAVAEVVPSSRLV